MRISSLVIHCNTVTFTNLIGGNLELRGILYTTLPTSGYKVIFSANICGVIRSDGLLVKASARNCDNPACFTGMMYHFISPVHLGYDSS